MKLTCGQDVMGTGTGSLDVPQTGGHRILVALPRLGSPAEA